MVGMIFIKSQNPALLLTNADFFHTAPDEFRLAEKCEQTLHSHGTVQYFPTVYTELTNQVES